MRSLSFLVVGLVLGLLIAKWSAKEIPPTPLPAAEKTECPPGIAPETKAQTPPQPKKLTFRPAQTVVVDREPARRTITLDSSMIREMESSWNDLRRQIRMARENGGWRVLEVERNSLFAKAGFVSGDLITENAVDSLRDQGPEAGDLPDRFRTILRYIQ